MFIIVYLSQAHAHIPITQTNIFFLLCTDSMSAYIEQLYK